MDSRNNGLEDQRRYPAAYAHIEEKVQIALDKIRQFDEQIKNTPNDRGPDLSYNPPGFIKSRQIGSRDQVIKSLEMAKAQVKEETWKDVEHTLKNDNSPSSRQTRDLAREDIYPNIYKSMDSAEKKEHRSKPKDIEQSQDFMAAALEDARNSQKELLPIIDQNEPSKIEQGRDIDNSQEVMNGLIGDFKQSKAGREEGSISPFSQRFSQSLNYTKTLEYSDKTKSPSKDKEGPDRD